MTALPSERSCVECHDPISVERVLQYPEISICLECMSEEQRTALERDLEAAAQAQRTTLPPLRLEHGGWEIGYVWQPHGAVSGDHVDVVRPNTPTEPLHLILGDVSGKGVAASLLQAQLHVLFRTLAPLEPNLSELVGRANRLFFESTAPASFATLAALRLHPDGKVALANAGHPRPLLADRRGVRPIEDASIPLGMLEEVRYEERALRVRSGETLLLYTDGLTEAERDGEMYGVGRAAAALRRGRDLPLDELLALSRSDLDEFLSGAALGDDLTLVAVRRRT